MQDDETGAIAIADGRLHDAKPLDLLLSSPPIRCIASRRICDCADSCDRGRCFLSVAGGCPRYPLRTLLAKAADARGARCGAGIAGRTFHRPGRTAGCAIHAAIF
ncbi:hypothetical protein K4L06_15640 [Lysobacter sp. BMK333-48F3]|uniref:hypothetical protein n=1 Tax=Lysobacter sp. BMK333-48F3 TaxID=2867962 RepID=UPI001C8B25C4|nr:hypothetical protein [Lysobacter sp. BMK333-48F3]MBX9402742.1 hypothetical protein [Lysobacter sp. BMK333-48F3]